MVPGIMKAEFDPGRGNYLLRGIEEIPLPEPILWWPETIGWLIVGLVLVGWSVRRALRWLRIWRRDAYRRKALRQLDALDFEDGHWCQAAACLPALLKRVALDAYAREEVASLSGQKWLEFLSAQCDRTAICEQTGSVLLQVAYQPISEWTFDQREALALARAVRVWIQNHRARVLDD